MKTSSRKHTALLAFAFATTFELLSPVARAATAPEAPLVSDVDEITFESSDDTVDVTVNDEPTEIERPTLEDEVASTPQMFIFSELEGSATEQSTVCPVINPALFGFEVPADDGENTQYCSIETQETEPEVENAEELIATLRYQQEREFSFLLKVLNQQVGTKLSPSAMGFFYLANFYTGYSAQAELQRVVDLWNFYNANAMKFYQNSVKLTDELAAQKLSPEEFTAKMVQSQQNLHAAANNAVMALRLIADTRGTAQAGADMSLAIADSAPALILPATLAAKVIVRGGSAVVTRVCATAATKPGASLTTRPLTTAAAGRPVAASSGATRPAASTVTNTVSQETIRVIEYIKPFPAEMQTNVVRPAIERVLQWERSLPPGTVIDQNKKLFILADAVQDNFIKVFGRNCGQQVPELISKFLGNLTMSELEYLLVFIK